MSTILVSISASLVTQLQITNKVISSGGDSLPDANHTCKDIWAMSCENLFLPYALPNKDTGQPAHPCSLVSIFVIWCLDSIIPPFSISEISSLYLVSVVVQASLSLTLSQTPKTGLFLMNSFIIELNVWCVQLKNQFLLITSVWLQIINRLSDTPFLQLRHTGCRFPSLMLKNLSVLDIEPCSAAWQAATQTTRPDNPATAKHFAHKWG